MRKTNTFLLAAAPTRSAAVPGGRVNAAHNQKRRRRPVADECYAAALPAFLIFGVWAVGCYLYVWLELCRSLAAVDVASGDHPHALDARRDVIRKLDQFLTGARTSERSEHAAAKRPNTQDEGRIADPIMANRIQSTLMSRTGYPNLILGAYIEPPLSVKGEGESARMVLRAHTPHQLKHTSYPYQPQQLAAQGEKRHQTMPGACSQKGAQWTFPTFHPKALDGHFGSNTFKEHADFEKRWELAMGIGRNGSSNMDNGEKEGYCPVDADPHLPWIHDAFPAADGRYLELIIANKRRCNTERQTFETDLENLAPQVALMQPVPVRRIKEDEADALGASLKKLWSPGSSDRGDDPSLAVSAADAQYDPPRYVLDVAPDAGKEDGRRTRFICRYHTLRLDNEGRGEPTLRTHVLGETLSDYPYNPEHANYLKKGSKAMLQPSHDEQIWNSIYTMRCPVPGYTSESRGNVNATISGSLAGIIAAGTSVRDGVPSLYLDLIPIRTPARLSREGLGLPGVERQFDPKAAWGEAHVLPRVKASGRWTNIPICRPPRADSVGATPDPSATESHTGPGETLLDRTEPRGSPRNNRTHFLVACVWAAAAFSTRGQTATDDSVGDRLREFMTYHTQIAGFDHVYVYDNSAAAGTNASLASVTNLFHPSLVTRIPWPHRLW